MTVNFYLDSKSNNKEEKSIYCYVRGLAVGKTIYINTGKKINPKHWNQEKQCARKTLVGHPEFNTYITDLSAEIQKRHSILISKKRNASFAEIKTEIMKIFEKEEIKKEFIEVLDLFSEIGGSTYSLSMIKKYKVLKNLLNEFQKSKKYKITFSSIDLLFYDKFTVFLQNDKHQTNNTVSKYFDLLKTFLKWATERNFNDKVDFMRFKATTEKTDIIYLNEKELLSIFYIDLSKSKHLERVRDVFCFACFTGQRFSDVSKLRREDIKNNFWFLSTTKTKDVLQIPLNDYALEILNKYPDSEKPLPIISSQKTNKYLKELCKGAEINDSITIVRYRGSERLEETHPKHELVSTHTARRTFVTLSLEKGMRAETVMEITGHSNYKTFKQYIKITSKVKTVEMNKIWRKEPVLKVVNL